MWYTPTTRVLTREGWTPFRDLKDVDTIYTEKGWKTVSIEKKKNSGDCYLFSLSCHGEYEFPERTIYQSFNGDTIEQVSLRAQYKKGSLKTKTIYLGHYRPRKELEYLFDDESWCDGYLIYHLFNKGIKQSASRTALFTMQIPDHRVGWYDLVFGTSSLSNRVKRYEKDGTPYYRFFVHEDEYSSYLHIGTHNRLNIMRTRFSDMSDNFIMGMACAVHDIYKINSRNEICLFANSYHRAKILDLLFYLGFGYHVRLHERKNTILVFAKREPVVQRIRLSEMEPMSYSGFIYSVKCDDMFPVRSSFKAFPYATKSKTLDSIRD